MGKAVFWSVPAHGDTNPLLATIKELVDRGEQVLYYGTEEFRNKVEMTGAEFRVFQGDINHIDFALAESDMLGFLKSLLSFALDKLRNNLDDVRREDPDYILHGCLSSWGKYLASILNIKAINLFHSAPMGKEDKIPDMPTLFGFLFPLFGYKLASKVRRTSLPYLLKEEFNIRVEYLDLLANVEALNVVYSSRFLSPQLADKDERHLFVGPSLYFKNSKGDFPYDKLTRAKSEEKHIVYISMGTIHSDNLPFYRTCFEALGDGNFLVILSAGSSSHEESLNPVPSNFMVEESVPQQGILAHVDLFLTHGGMNSVNEALFNGVPMVVFPHHMEQAASARRVARLGCGLTADIKKINSGKLLHIVTEVLENPDFRQKAGLHRKLIREDEERSHIRAVEAILDYVR